MDEIIAKVTEAFKAAGKPVSAGEIVKLSGLAKADVDKAFKEMKKEGTITSPVRCKWELAAK
ncbi:MAG: transcriptional regulator [Eubacteriaceae bacterium]|nr:transcriptional regulator [Eubacteriaceae bacterium]